jgi:hypothetical protein
MILPTGAVQVKFRTCLIGLIIANDRPRISSSLSALRISQLYKNFIFKLREAEQEAQQGQRCKC